MAVVRYWARRFGARSSEAIGTGQMSQNHRVRFAGPGQRDDSWGACDWWAADWMWSAFHLEDDTHSHLVTTPGLVGHGIGYVQSDGDVIEIAEAHSDHAVRDEGWSVPTVSR